MITYRHGAVAIAAVGHVDVGPLVRPDEKHQPPRAPTSLLSVARRCMRQRIADAPGAQDRAVAIATATEDARRDVTLPFRFRMVG